MIAGVDIGDADGYYSGVSLEYRLKLLVAPDAQEAPSRCSRYVSLQHAFETLLSAVACFSVGWGIGGEEFHYRVTFRFGCRHVW